MKVGLDFWQTITRDPAIFRDLADSLLRQGHEVHVITAIGAKRAERIIDDVTATGVPMTKLHYLIFQHPNEAPELKLAKCQELGIDMMVDDRRDICQLLNTNGIIALQIMRKDNRDYDPEKQL